MNPPCCEEAISQAFLAFAGGDRMDGRGFVRCLREARLLESGKVKPAEADLIFTRLRPRDSRKIDEPLFRQALNIIASKHGVEERCVFENVCAACGLLRRGSENGGTSLGSTSRLFYDRSSYTGTHKNGGPTTLGCGACEHDVITDQELVNRSHVGRMRSALLGNSLDEEETSISKDETKASREEGLVGPARFFYDKSTYTGTHRNGGPDVVGSGRPKQYMDFSEVVQRERVLDDPLQRRLRRTSERVLPAEHSQGSRESTPDRRQLLPQTEEECPPRTEEAERSQEEKASVCKTAPEILSESRPQEQRRLPVLLGKAEKLQVPHITRSKEDTKERVVLSKLYGSLLSSARGGEADSSPSDAGTNTTVAPQCNSIGEHPFPSLSASPCEGATASSSDPLAGRQASQPLPPHVLLGSRSVHVATTLSPRVDLTVPAAPLSSCSVKPGGTTRRRSTGTLPVSTPLTPAVVPVRRASVALPCQAQPVISMRERYITLWTSQG